MTRDERRRAAALAAAVAALHVAGFGLLLAYAGRAAGFTAGLGLTAYALGLRHAFDADHITAIDNTTRRLIRPGRRPLGVGFAFSLGHSTVVLVLSLLLAAGVHALAGDVRNDASSLHHVTTLVGTLVSGTFLLLIAALNVGPLRSILALMRRGELDEHTLERALEQRGLVNRLAGRVTRRIGRTWQMYPLGILFGLGFDTATEVALLTLAAGTAFSGLPAAAIVCLPILFAAGMSLLDTLDGALMSVAYGWAFAQPERKLLYNLAVTGLSIAVAVAVGGAELLSLAGVTSVDLGALGYVVTALFALAWLLAATVRRRAAQGASD